MSEWEDFDHDGAIFRRPKGGVWGITHVFSEKSQAWKPYEGRDKSKAIAYGDLCEDPLAGADGSHESAPRDMEMAKSEPPHALFLRKP